MLNLLVKMRLLILRKMLSLFLLILGKFVKTDDKLVIFASFNGKAYSDNPRYLFEYLRDHEEFASYHFVWAFKVKRSVNRAKVVKFNSFSYYYLLSKAKYWVFNSKMAPYYHKKGEQVYLQTWHGTPLKRLGHDILDNGITYYRSRLSYQQMLRSYDEDSRHWDYLISPNPFSSQAFTSAFNLDKEKLLEVGYPRVDCLVNVDSSKCMELKQRYGLPIDKKVVLYAPTWRDDSFGIKGYRFELAVDFYKWKNHLGDDTVILFKPHYLISNVYQVPNDLSDFVYLMAASADINDAYLMSDVLITDYSSVFFDYANLNRPIYFYMYDFEQYEQELRGFYLKVPDDLPNDVIRTEKELLRRLKEGVFDYERLRTFNQVFNSWNDGDVSSKVAKRIFYEN
ncbi:CDP-glycerol glycerophosphotransferase family protein [Lactococcus lactis]|uniref:CDP-glycerol glycerophosphotransferase family protein n=2 Tax=Lactococcus lactis TaxID=1358 RepID=A0ABD5GRW2_9LACT|nr:CDP-glycerol glycerophosphotransferase family protein [Lactococcus lactis]KST82420.1 CDP-ribitol:poly(ribitol phosphate) ribitol phosphotransferase [Lactococcus lactis subsp. lactis]MBU3886142.1 CDP-glycerol glycerophosphotransferase family protein [Lactococcus lactis]MCT0076154.1 CDP-glycerol glycerophosphotransferase family protein [Lactococcus lactis subsp. lactis]MCT3119802.1 CDP-glycerol glycerophosphotransferase family protein [Lactococcus lactis]MDH5113966.1 CDP-glycerol glycerophosp